MTTSTYNGYPVEFDGQWMKVFSHYSGTGDYWSSANDWDEAKWSNPDNPSANKYSILDYVKNFQFNGTYTFKLVYPQNMDRNNIWSQDSNPLDITEVKDNFITIETGWGSNYWGGLTRSSSGVTFLDGSNPHSNWYFAVGSAVSWSGATNFPGPGVAVNRVELWVKATPDTMKAIYDRNGAAAPSNVDVKGPLGEWNGTSPNPVSRASMVGLPVNAGRDLQVWGHDGTEFRFYSAAQNPGELKHIAEMLASQKFNYLGDGINWLNSNGYYVHNADLYPVIDGLVAAYDFANPESFKGDGKLYDLSGNNHTLIGATNNTVEDVNGVKGFYFRNLGSFVLPYAIGSLGNGGNCTLESMIYADANELTSGDRGAIIQGHIYMSWNKSNRRLSSYWYSTNNRGYHEPSLQMNREQWYHLTTVWNQSTGQLKQYIDGVLQNTVNTIATDGYMSGLRIGDEGAGRQFSGAIAFANIYNKVLSDSDVTRNYEYYSKRIR